jgi:bifunctional non-homologous end joining protein LigD
LAGLAQWITENRAKNAVLDGELVCLDDRGGSSFNDLLFRRRPPIFYAFDILWWDGADLRDYALTWRKDFLKRRLPVVETNQILFADHIEEKGVAFFERACELDLEGIVAKRKASLYRDGTRWLKIRNPKYTQKEGRKELFGERFSPPSSR